MSQQSWMPEQTHLLTPYIMVKDADASLDFYQRAFGFEGSVMMRDPAGKAVHAEVRRNGVLIAMFATEGAFGSTQQSPASSGSPSPVGLYMYCEDVDALVARAVAAGAEAVGEVDTQFWGDRTGCLRDPDGYGWTFATQVADFDPSKIPPGFKSDF